MNSCEQIRTAMMAYDWIGFDLFDTLLLRPFLQPDDLFCQMEHLKRSVRQIRHSDLCKCQILQHCGVRRKISCGRAENEN